MCVCVFGNENGQVKMDRLHVVNTTMGRLKQYDAGAAAAKLVVNSVNDEHEIAWWIHTSTERASDKKNHRIYSSCVTHHIIHTHTLLGSLASLSSIEWTFFVSNCFYPYFILVLSVEFVLAEKREARFISALQWITYSFFFWFLCVVIFLFSVRLLNKM